MARNSWKMRESTRTFLGWEQAKFTGPPEKSILAVAERLRCGFWQQRLCQRRYSGILNPRANLRTSICTATWASMNKGQTMRNVLWEHVSVQHHNDSDDSCKRDRVPEHEAEDLALLADLIGGRGSDANGLRIDHLAHHTTGAIAGAHQNRTQVELLGSNSLQSAEKRVGRGVAAGQRDTQPADIGSEEGK